MGGYDVGGMLYVGSGLTSLSYHQDSREPSLLDPRLTVGRGMPDLEGRLLTYWPSYSALLPECRQAHLEWLAGGRGPGAAIGYVFLFFYGLERRLLIDTAKSESARVESDLLLAEVERLLGLYGSHRSFHSYARNLLSFVRLTRPVRIEDLRPPLQRANLVEAPLTLRVALGLFAKEGRPLPVEWALSCAFTAPQIRLRTPAERCPDEFRALFTLRYREAFGTGGMIVQPGLTKLTATYHPASPTFSGQVSLTLDLPEVVGWITPLRKIQEITDGVLQDLDAYSRWVGRTGDSRSPAAAALLPAALARGRETEETRRLVQWIEGELGGESTAVIDGTGLFAEWPLKVPGKAAKRDAETLAIFLGRRGFGMEPDVRFGGPPPGDGPAVLFRLTDDLDEPTAAYHAAAVLLHLSVALSVADGDVTVREERHLLAHLEASLHLSAAERTRLKAHLRWLLAAPPGLGGLKKRVAPLAESQRRGIGQFLITVAGADGHIGAEELKLLARIYVLLGLDRQAVYSDVHALAAAAPPPAAEPVTVRPADLPAAFPIPATAAPAAPEGGFALDLRKIQAKLAETEQVSSLLEGIFREEAPHPPAPSVSSGSPSFPPGEGETLAGLAGLDGAHSELLRRLAGKTAWPRLDIEHLADELGLLPDGALEVLNEAAYERCGAVLFEERFEGVEGDETIEIDREVLQQIMEELTAT